jgi:hypothetical protein
MQKFFQPTQDVQDELDVYLRRVCPSYFKETNIHQDPVGISYDNKGGKVTAVVTLRWQRKSDYKGGQHTALFDYQETRTHNGGKYQWYCTSGLPGD